MIGTRAMLDYLRQDGALREDREGYDNLMRAKYGDEMQIGNITLEMKRRRRKQMLQQMMKDAGFGDLTKIAQPMDRKVNYDINEI